MARNYNRYQYETSPRKLEPEYAPRRNPYSKKKSTAINQQKIKKEKIQAQKRRAEKLQEQKRKREQVKIIIYILLGFSVLFAVSYRNSMIDESFSQVQALQKELGTIQKENEQLKVSIENGSNLNNLEQSAKELLGMQKLSSKQTVYVSLPKTDYIEGTEEEEEQEEKTSLIDTIFGIF